MNIVALDPPGRFPTTVPDTGRWWSVITAQRSHSLVRLGLNAAWWHLLCNPSAVRLLVPGTPSRLSRWVGGDPATSAQRAGVALERLHEWKTYQSAKDYLQAAADLGAYLRELNGAQTALRFGLAWGVRVRGVAYDDSRSLYDYAQRSSPLASLTELTLDEAPRTIDLAVVTVRGAEELLNAMIVAGQLRRRSPGVHVCLADHSAGSFSLTPHVAQLSESGALSSAFDTIIARRKDRDELVPAIAAAIERGERPTGFIHRGDIPPIHSRPGQYTPPPTIPTFTPEPVLRMRISSGRCYWDRCTFCVQTEHEFEGASMARDVPEAVERLTALRRAGLRYFIFADEALSPQLLRVLCKAVSTSGLAIRWACRSKFERSYDAELFTAMYDAGCREVMFGLESTSENTLRRMDKLVEGLAATDIARIVRAADAAGLGIHLNLIAGFPGERRGELRKSVDFVAEALSATENPSFSLTPFMLFSQSPIARDPQAHGIRPLPLSGDMPFIHQYVPELSLRREACAISAAVPGHLRRLTDAMGCSALTRCDGDSAMELYSETGHGLLLKSQPANPLSNARRRRAAQASKRGTADSIRHTTTGS